jgi:putative acyl-CoA dehydrogenase
LARAPGLDCERTGIRIMWLKDKLGDRANASAEIEYHGAEA